MKRSVPAVLAVIFGCLTIFSGGAALAGKIDMGATVGFVLWFNFLAGFGYVAAGVLIWRASRWAYPLAAGLLAATLLVFAAFGLHVLSGQPYEGRTLGAMAIRSAFLSYLFGIARKFRAVA